MTWQFWNVWLVLKPGGTRPSSSLVRLQAAEPVPRSAISQAGQAGRSKSVLARPTRICYPLKSSATDLGRRHIIPKRPRSPCPTTMSRQCQCPRFERPLHHTAAGSKQRVPCLICADDAFHQARCGPLMWCPDCVGQEGESPAAHDLCGPCLFTSLLTSLLSAHEPYRVECGSMAAWLHGGRAYRLGRLPEGLFTKCHNDWSRELSYLPSFGHVKPPSLTYHQRGKLRRRVRRRTYPNAVWGSSHQAITKLSPSYHQAITKLSALWRFPWDSGVEVVVSKFQRPSLLLVGRCIPRQQAQASKGLVVSDLEE